MSEEKKDQPTASIPIFVGSGPAVQIAAELALTITDWMLREDDGIRLLASPPGELSGWMLEMFTKDIQLEHRNVSDRDKRAVQQEVMREAFSSMVDPSKKEERQLLDLLGKVAPGAVQQVVESLQEGDTRSFNAARSSMLETASKALPKSVTPELGPALGALAARSRAARAAALCAVLYRTHALSLISQARSGNPGAVLKLIKIDKLFLTDSCTAQVIQQAELRIDRVFLRQLAKAIAYKPKMGWRQACKLYTYLILAYQLPLPTLPILQLRIDPDGTRFKTFEAFEKFVERCRKELKVLGQAAAASISDASLHRGKYAK